MLHINESIESRDFKINNLFPVTTGHIPGSIQIDSSVLSAIFKINWQSLGALSDNHEYIWDQVFNLQVTILPNTYSIFLYLFNQIALVAF